MQNLRQSILLQAPVDAVQRAFLDESTQRRILGGDAEVSSTPGSPFLLMDGLIHGSNAYVAPGEIVQSWRMAIPSWPAETESRVTLRLRPEGTGTRVHLEQAWVPQGCLQAVQEHWSEHVWPGLRSELEPKPRHELRMRWRRLLDAI